MQQQQQLCQTHSQRHSRSQISLRDAGKMIFHCQLLPFNCGFHGDGALSSGHRELLRLLIVLTVNWYIWFSVWNKQSSSDRPGRDEHARLCLLNQVFSGGSVFPASSLPPGLSSTSAEHTVEEVKSQNIWRSAAASTAGASLTSSMRSWRATAGVCGVIHLSPSLWF